jgi:NitT/TauT family transport system substrate-binding protein
MGTGGIIRLLLAAALLLPAPAAPAQQPPAQQPLKKVRIAVGTTVLNLSYPWLNLPVALGYWRDEGYDVEVLPVGASLQALQQMVGGNADFAEVNSSVIVQANVVNNIPVRTVMANGVIDWAVGVPADGAIRDVHDLKGKTIGVFSLATGGIAFLKSYLRQNGMDPDRDVTLVATGLGAPAVDALRTNKVQALLYWAAAMAGFENAGLNLRYLRAPDWRGYPDLSLSTLQKTAAADPKMVEAIARGAARATVFALANPDCVRQIQWERFPSTKPTGADDATLRKWDLRLLNAQLDTLRDGFALNGGKLWGNVDPVGFERIEAFMLESKQIPKTLPATTFLLDIPGFYERVNDFDAEATRAAAMACQTH